MSQILYLGPSSHLIRINRNFKCIFKLFFSNYRETKVTFLTKKLTGILSISGKVVHHRKNLAETFSCVLPSGSTKAA